MRSFRRDHRIDRVFKHQHLIGGRQSNRAAGPAFANDDRNQRHLDVKAGFDRSRDGFGLAAGFGIGSGEGASGINQRDDRDVEAFGHAHQADCLAIAFGLGHAEIVFDAGFGIAALFMTDHHHAASLQTAKAADDGFVFAKQAVTGQRREVFKQVGDIVGEMRAVRMTGNLGLLPRGQLAIGVLQQLGQLVLQARDFVCDVTSSLSVR